MKESSMTWPALHCPLSLKPSNALYGPGRLVVVGLSASAMEIECPLVEVITVTFAPNLGELNKGCCPSPRSFYPRRSHW